MFSQEVAPRGKPVVFRGLVRDWPAVNAARGSSEQIAHYLKKLDLGVDIPFVVGRPANQGRLFYEPSMQALNFERRASKLSAALDEMLAERNASEPRSLYLQSLPLPQVLPAFAEENHCALAPQNVFGRIWIGNSVTVPPHFDLSDNIACVVAGRRQFTLFPPEQLANMYMGPIDFTPAGTPVSMASIEHPDFERHPRFKTALESAQQAVLEPGDAVYIPYAWWHGITSLESFNILVNYWWNEATSWVKSPYDSLLLAVLALRDLPPEQRRVWRGLFDHVVFQEAGEAFAHLEPAHRGALGPLNAERARMLRQMLARTLMS
ncbi:MAG: cupin-like domain-containing protein [Pseudomonadota bacterium]